MIEAIAVPCVLLCVLEVTVQGVLSVIFVFASSGAVTSTSPSMSAIVTPLPLKPMLRASLR